MHFAIFTFHVTTTSHDKSPQVPAMKKRIPQLQNETQGMVNEADGTNRYHIQGNCSCEFKKSHF